MGGKNLTTRSLRIPWNLTTNTSKIANFPRPAIFSICIYMWFFWEGYIPVNQLRNLAVWASTWFVSQGWRFCWDRFAQTESLEARILGLGVLMSKFHWVLFGDMTFHFLGKTFYFIHEKRKFISGIDVFFPWTFHFSWFQSHILSCVFPQHFSGHFLRAHQSSDLSDYFGDYFSCLVRGFTEKSIESIERLNNWPGLDSIQFWPPNL